MMPFTLALPLIVYESRAGGVDERRVFDIVRCVGALCSRSFSQSCSVTIKALGTYTDPVQEFEVMLPVDTRFSLKTACSHYGDYENCVETYGDNCTEDFKDTETFHTVFKPLCRDHYKQYLSHLDCYRRMKKYFGTCRRKRRSKMPSGLQSSRGSYWCRITGDFITCMYSNTALGCSIEAANVYLTIMNKTVETLPHTGAPCAFVHPLDLLKTTSPPSASTSPLYMLRDAEQVSNGQYQSINPAHNSQGHLYMSLMYILLLIDLLFFSYANIL